MLDSPIKQPGFRTLQMATSQTATGYSNTNTRFNVKGLTLVSIEITGTATSFTLYAYGELGTTTNTILNFIALDGTVSSTAIANGRYFIDVSGFENLKLYVSAISGGNISLYTMGVQSQLSISTKKVELQKQFHLENNAYINASGLNQSWDLINNTQNFTVLTIDVTNSSVVGGSIFIKADGTLGVKQLKIFDTINGIWVDRIVSTGIYRLNISGLKRWQLQTSGITSGTFTVGYRMGFGNLNFEKANIETPLIYRVKAKVSLNTLTLDSRYKEVVVTNKDLIIPAEVGFTSSSRFYVAPGQSIKLRSNNSTLLNYYSFASEIDLEIQLGNDLYIPTNFTNQQKFMIGKSAKQIMFVVDNFMIYESSGTLYFSKDLGETSFSSHSFGVSHSQAWITYSGTLLVWTSDNYLWRSTDFGLTWSKAQTGGSDLLCWEFHNHKAIASNGNTICFAEYGGDLTHPDGSGSYKYIWKSIDDGATWTKVLSKEFQTSGGDTTKIRHFHSCIYSVNYNEWYAMTGDSDDNVHWYKSSDGTTWQQILNIGYEQKYRILSPIISQDGYIYFATDSSSQNGIRRVLISSLSVTSSSDPLTEEFLFCIKGEVYTFEMLNGVMIATTKVYGGINDRLSAIPSIYYSEDMGTTWKKLLSWKLAETSTIKTTSGGFYSYKGIDNEGYIYIQVGTMCSGIGVSPEGIRYLKIKV